MSSRDNQEHIKSILRDEFLMKNSSDFTKELLQTGMDINSVCKVIKEYQRCYLLIKDNSTFRR